MGECKRPREISLRQFANMTEKELAEMTHEETTAVLDKLISSLRVLPQGHEQSEAAYRELIQLGDF